MILTIICTDDSPAMKRQLERELEGIDYQVINEVQASDAVKAAKGDFLLFLQKDSAINRGSIKSSLMLFLNNMSDKRLAAVTPVIDFDDVNDLYIPTVQNGKWRFCKPGSNGVHPVRTFSKYGSVFRKASYLKAAASDPSLDAGVGFWNSKLRVMCNPAFVYYAPDLYRDKASVEISVEVPELVKKTWAKEHITK